MWPSLNVFSMPFLWQRDYGHPERVFFNPKLLGLGRQIGIQDSETVAHIIQVRLCKRFDPILIGLSGKKTASDICLTLTFKLFRTHVLVYHYAFKGYPSYNAV